MDYQKLNSILPAVINGENDYMFQPVVDSLHCMSTPRVYAILNAVVSSTTGIYVEVGTYQGGSLISALLGNDRQALGVDSFGEFTATNNLQTTVGNLEKFQVADRVQMHNMGFKEFFSKVPASFQIDAYYYDGEHNYDGQLAGMEAAWPYLRPGSAVIVDDLIYPEVTHAVNQFIANHARNLKFNFIMMPNESTDPVWWNGVCVLQVT